MIAANMAPGMNRSFLSESWTNLIPKKCWYDAIDEATEMVDDTVKVDIQGYDIDGEVIKAARENAESRSGSHDSFPGAPGGAAEPSEEIWLYYHKPALRRAYRGEKNLPALYKTIGNGLRRWIPGRCT